MEAEASEEAKATKEAVRGVIYEAANLGRDRTLVRSLTLKTIDMTYRTMILDFGPATFQVSHLYPITWSLNVSSCTLNKIAYLLHTSCQIYTRSQWESVYSVSQEVRPCIYHFLW